MNDLINNFNYDSPELREQLDTIGMTPDEVSAEGAMCPVFLGAAKLLTPVDKSTGRRSKMLQTCARIDCCEDWLALCVHRCCRRSWPNQSWLRLSASQKYKR